jgi:hypothetical protein
MAQQFAGYVANGWIGRLCEKLEAHRKVQTLLNVLEEGKNRSMHRWRGCENDGRGGLRVPLFFGLKIEISFVFLFLRLKFSGSFRKRQKVPSSNSTIQGRFNFQKSNGRWWNARPGKTEPPLTPPWKGGER